MKNKRIIYPQDNGTVAILIPSPYCELTLDEIAAKDVPPGKPWQVVDAADIPEDRSFRDAWEFDFDV